MDYKELYVVVKMWKGTIDDVSVYRKEPKDLEPIDDAGDNGNFIYLTQIEEEEVWVKKLNTKRKKLTLTNLRENKVPSLADKTLNKTLTSTNNEKSQKYWF